MSALNALLFFTGLTKMVAAFFTLRAAYMKLGPGAEKLRVAFWLAGMMLIAEGTLLLSMAAELPIVVTTIWAAGVAAWTFGLAVFLAVRQFIHREALSSGSNDER